MSGVRIPLRPLIYQAFFISVDPALRRSVHFGALWITGRFLRSTMSNSPLDAWVRPNSRTGSLFRRPSSTPQLPGSSLERSIASVVGYGDPRDRDIERVDLVWSDRPGKESSPLDGWIWKRTCRDDKELSPTSRDRLRIGILQWWKPRTPAVVATHDDVAGGQR